MFDFYNTPSEKLSLKYSDSNVPKDYDVSEMFFTFDFIYLMHVRDASLDKAIDGVSREYGLSYDYLEDYLINNHFILNKTNKKDFFNQLKAYSTKSLKKILKINGFKASGKREKIEQKLYENRLLAGNYQLSSKSKVFYRNKKRRFEIFNDFLFDSYYFDEFNEYYMDNFRKKKNKIPIDFINQHINKAIVDENHDVYISNLQIMAEVYYEYKNYKRMLECVLKIYCADLNPSWKLNDLNNHCGLSKQTYNLLLFLQKELGKNRIISAYFAVWDSFNFDSIIVSKYAGYRYLKIILNSNAYDKIIRELNETFYRNDDLKIKKITQKTLFDF